MSFYYRIDFDEETKNKLIELVKSDSEILKLVENAKTIKKSEKKVEAMKKANKSKSKTCVKKIENAINLLRFENRNITMYAIQKVSGVSYSTVMKHRDLFGY